MEKLIKLENHNIQAILSLDKKESKQSERKKWVKDFPLNIHLITSYVPLGVGVLQLQQESSTKGVSV